MYSFEKRGEVPRDQRRMEAFRDTLEECQLMDIGYSGAWFTGNVQHLAYSTSDHCPILINTDSEVNLSGSRRFHFESWWILEESFEGVIKEFWDSSSVLLVEKLENLQTRLKKWACVTKSKKGGLKKKLTEELEILLRDERDDETMARIIDTTIQLNMEIDKDKIRANTINKLVLDDGKEITNGTEITEVVAEYFEDLFVSKGIGNPHKVLEGIGTNISHEINEGLLSPFREEEVWTALKGMGPTKALGSDGFPTLFFQKFWHIVVNVTEIVLIPKIPNPTSLVNFRPISLCTVLYKIVAKTIANRL
ncbi:reverse transcriptase [Gossypium australe]|uniref:Reverse transcriptase n=1 Tax=Gossypium australe TaxID=47621 RepID=A0A5B6VJG3_9ROSI|nr:reverse transcriptase [Gossypium australe]